MRTSHRLIALGACAVAILMSAVGSASAAEPFWRAEESQIPAETTANVLRDVSCNEYFPETETYACIGVGNSVPKSGGSKPLIELGSSGLIGGWGLFPPPMPSSAEYPGAVLEAISCPIETFCQAVGYYSPKAGVRRPLAERMNSSYEWTFEKPAIPGADEFTELNGISCTSAYSCEAVGTTKATSSSSLSKTLTEKFNGLWSLQTSFSSLGVENKLADVSCTAVNSCMAVGRNGSTALSEAYNGTEWKQVATGAAGLLEGVSCTASNACTAVGETSGKIVARRWNGTAWVAQAPVIPAGSTTSIGADVTCLTATECVAVGSYISAGSSHALAERWNGTGWSQDSLSALKGSSAETLLGVTCRAAILCSAVGSATVSGVVKPLPEVYR